MLTPEQIQQALSASRVATLNIAGAHGPLGLDELAETVARTVQARGSQTLIERPPALPLQTWEKLDEIARLTTSKASQPTSASAVAAVLLAQCVATK